MNVYFTIIALWKPDHASNLFLQGFHQRVQIFNVLLYKTLAIKTSSAYFFK